MWGKFSLRARLNAIFALLLFTALAAALATLALKAGPRVRAEDDSTMRLAREFVETALDSLKTAPEPEAAVATLLGGLSNLRHVNISIERPGAPASPPAPAGEARAPAWFAALIAPEAVSVRIPVEVGGRRLGDVAIASDPQDEIAEIWDQATTLLVGGLALVLAVTLLNMWIVRRSLQPVGDLEAALARLASGDYAARLTPAGPPEFRAIGSALNVLAQELGRARGENRSLTQRLVSAQDDERKSIAHELHDEFGPYLFAIRAHASALKAQATGDIARSCAAVIEGVEALQQRNRQVLARLRPPALTDLGLSAALGALADMWRASQPHVTIEMQLPEGLDGASETTALTLYRIVQEALTNVFRHAQATRVEIEVAHGEAGRGLSIRVRDNGVGLSGAPGFGLTGMEERVRALEGEIRIENAAGGGVMVEARLPAG